MNNPNNYIYNNAFAQANRNGATMNTQDQVKCECYYDPYVFATLQSVLGANLVIETTRGNVTGKLVDVKPDHCVIESFSSKVFVRIQQIVTIMPI